MTNQCLWLTFLRLAVLLAMMASGPTVTAEDQASARASDPSAEDRAVRMVQKRGGTVKRIVSGVREPVVSLYLVGSRVTDEDLKELRNTSPVCSGSRRQRG